MCVELVLQLCGIGRQIPVWAEFDPAVAGLGDLSEKLVGRQLLRVAWEPHTPGVWSGADGDRGHSPPSHEEFLGCFVLFVDLPSVSGGLESRALADRHIPPGLRVGSSDQRIGFYVDHDRLGGRLYRL